VATLTITDGDIKSRRYIPALSNFATRLRKAEAAA
jgi:hypothetical protein